ncbi:patatin-like phospholipase family protein [Massilia sp. H-1]|nr:patatin-like phospholipase family protein [Massilia sp. H-1]
MPTTFRTLGAAAAAVPVARLPRPGPTQSRAGVVRRRARGVAHIGVLKVLEEMHIPVDYVVGTSMGSIVVSAYAMGNDPKDLAARLEKVKWNEVLDDNPPRLARTTYTKANERNSISSRELGFRDAELQVPRGLNYGQQIEFFFNTLAARTGDIDHFDQLDIPYRAVATDIETGKMVVLERGAIARAMRASMSVPGVFAPVDIDGHALLDGGLVRNLPVDVARSMGADVIIAVNLGTALLKRDQITSVFGVGQQMLNILTEQNVEASLRQLTPTDVLITPALGEYSAADFDNAASTIVIGEAATRAVAPQLATLALDDDAWKEHMAARKGRHLPRSKHHQGRAHRPVLPAPRERGRGRGEGHDQTGRHLQYGRTAGQPEQPVCERRLPEREPPLRAGRRRPHAGDRAGGKGMGAELHPRRLPPVDRSG